MEVHRVGVHAVVRDLPDLVFAVLDRLGRRVNVAQRNGGLVQHGGERKFSAEGGVHATVVGVEQFLNTLAQHGYGFDSGRATGRLIHKDRGCSTNAATADDVDGGCSVVTYACKIKDDAADTATGCVEHGVGLGHFQTSGSAGGVQQTG